MERFTKQAAAGLAAADGLNNLYPVVGTQNMDGMLAAWDQRFVDFSGETLVLQVVRGQ